MYHNGTDWVRLAKGEAGQVLVVNDAGTFPQWGTTDNIFKLHYQDIKGIKNGITKNPR
jgi:hypothetical protein